MALRDAGRSRWRRRRSISLASRAGASCLFAFWWPGRPSSTAARTPGWRCRRGRSGWPP